MALLSLVLETFVMAISLSLSAFVISDYKQDIFSVYYSCI